jgi:hypothetical protein
VPLVCEAHRDAVVTERPHFLDHSVVRLAVPLARRLTEATPKTRGASARLQAASAGARPIYSRGLRDRQAWELATEWRFRACG